MRLNAFYPAEPLSARKTQQPPRNSRRNGGAADWRAVGRCRALTRLRRPPWGRRGVAEWLNGHSGGALCGAPRKQRRGDGGEPHTGRPGTRQQATETREHSAALRRPVPSVDGVHVQNSDGTVFLVYTFSGSDWWDAADRHTSPVQAPDGHTQTLTGCKARFGQAEENRGESGLTPSIRR